jgi:hypothetical protein
VVVLPVAATLPDQPSEPLPPVAVQDEALVVVQVSVIGSLVVTLLELAVICTVGGTAGVEIGVDGANVTFTVAGGDAPHCRMKVISPVSEVVMVALPDAGRFPDHPLTVPTVVFGWQEEPSSDDHVSTTLCPGATVDTLALRFGARTGTKLTLT